MATYHVEWSGKNVEIVMRYIRQRCEEGHVLRGDEQRLFNQKSVVPLALRTSEGMLVAVVGYSLFRQEFYIRETAAMNGHMTLEEVINPQSTLPGLEKI